MTLFGLVALIVIVVILGMTLRGKRSVQRAQTTGLVLFRPWRVLLLAVPVGGFGVFLIVQAEHQHVPNLIFGGLILLLPALCMAFAALRQCIRALEAFIR